MCVGGVCVKMLKKGKLQRKREAQFLDHRRLAAYWQRKGSTLHRRLASEELAENEALGITHYLCSKHSLCQGQIQVDGRG